MICHYIVVRKVYKGCFPNITMNKIANKLSTQKQLKKEQLIEKYYCSIHGGNGNPNCSECWDKLKLLADDNNALLVGEDGKLIN